MSHNMQNLCLSKSSFITLKKTQLVLMHKFKKIHPFESLWCYKNDSNLERYEIYFQAFKFGSEITSFGGKSLFGQPPNTEGNKTEESKPVISPLLAKGINSCISFNFMYMYQYRNDQYVSNLFFSLYIQCHHYIGLFYFGDFQLCQQNQMKMNWFQRKLKL